MKARKTEPYKTSHAINRKEKERDQLKKENKLPWTPETVELLCKYIKEYKMKCEFGGVDLEAMTSGFRGFVGRHSPRVNPTHVKEGYLMTLPQG